MDSRLETIAKSGRAFIEVPQALRGLVRQALQTAIDLFDLPESTKAACRTDETQFKCGWRKPPDAACPSEVWHVQLREPDGFWPANMESERRGIRTLLEEGVQLAAPLLDQLAQRFGGQPAGRLEQSILSGDSTLRLLNYRASNEAERFAPHLDYGLATLFLAETEPGLEVQQPEGDWIVEGGTPDKCLLCAGEMLDILTSGKIRAVWHRVRQVPLARYSIALFIHPESSFVLSRKPDGDLTAADYFADRIRELATPD